MNKKIKASMGSLLNREIQDFQAIGEALVSHIAEARDVILRDGVFDVKFMKALLSMKDLLVKTEMEIKKIVEEAKTKGG